MNTVDLSPILDPLIQIAGLVLGGFVLWVTLRVAGLLLGLERDDQLGCGCPDNCRHWSDCAIHNAPAYAPGPCDCGGYLGPWGTQQPKRVRVEQSRMVDL